MVYVVASAVEEADTLGKIVVEEKLAACANILGQSKSIFFWNDGLNTNLESVLILKTSGRKKTALIERLIELHSYTCPCVLAFKVDSGNDEFLKWVDEEVG